MKIELEELFRNASYVSANKVLAQDRLAGTFDGKTVFITGGTGFLGKVLIEKLLRKCEKIGKIIMLMRSKKGKQPRQRIEEMFKGALFVKLLEIRGLDHVMSKVVTVTGDSMLPHLGLSDEEKQLACTANIIVHTAASIRFDEDLKTAVLLNTRGTKFALDMAKECPNLELFIHTSTAYSHPYIKVLEEKPYPPPGDPHKVIELVELTDLSTIDVITPKLLGDYPNTYAYSKALAEALAVEAMDTLPVLMIRPSIVVPIYKQPLPGWTDNINGPTGLLIGAGKGVIRTMYGDESSFADLVPVDCVVNCIVLATWDYIVNGCKHRIINVATSQEMQITWGEILDIGKEVIADTVAFDTVLWRAGGGMTKYRWLHKLQALLYHWIPAVLVDMLLFCLGYKPVLLHAQRRVNKGMEVTEYYTTHEWFFKADTLISLREKITDDEREEYVIDSRGLEVWKYFASATLAARRYILKEKDEDIPKALRLSKIMKYLDIGVKTIFYGYISYWVFNKVQPYMSN